MITIDCQDRLNAPSALRYRNSLLAVRGFTLIELMVSMTIVLAGYATMHAINSQKQRIEDFQRVNMVAKLSGAAGAAYYRHYCQATPFVQPTQATLIAENFMTNASGFDKPIGSAFVFNITTGANDEVTVNVSSAFSSNNIAKQVAKYSKNGSVSNAQVTWSFKPQYQSIATNIHMSQLAAAYAAPTC